MNKPVAIVCALISSLGLLILGCGTYCALVYGHGSLEAGNFHRCIYWSERDLATGKVERRWDTNWDLVSSTEGSPWVDAVDMWFVGLLVSVAGPSMYLFERASRDKRNAF